MLILIIKFLRFFLFQKNKCDRLDDEPDEDMIFMLGGSLRDPDRKPKHSKKPILPDPPDDLLDPMMFNEGLCNFMSKIEIIRIDLV